ncbi:MAG: 6-phosphogluconolactonase [Deltaproteobacteria bacterium]|nr:6-phosphogluconolactonase [Deltaproteobacteria bacterium]
MKEARGELIVCNDPEELAYRAAREFAQLVNQFVAESGRFVAALSGGSTPRRLYSVLASSEFQNKILWSNVHLFWGDERCVPADHPESNYRMVNDVLLSKVPVPKENIYRIQGEKPPEVGAREYEQNLRAFFQVSGNQFPRFDLILLGLGEDGHTASLFPGSSVLRETNRWVVALYVERLATHRLTLTLPVLNKAANVFFLVTGQNKASILRRILSDREPSQDIPARLVQPANGNLVWWVDRKAAKWIQ